MVSLADTEEKLSRAQSGLLRAADTVSAGQWRTNPAKGQWSAAEVIAHLIIVEKSIIHKSDRILQHPPRRITFFQRFHLPMAFAERRFLRLKSPLPMEDRKAHV